MSHFSVAVAVPANRMSDAEMTDSSILEAILDQIMEPFNESTDFHEYMEFEDLTEEMKEAYDKKTVDMVQFPDGHRCTVMDSEFYLRFQKIDDGRIAEFLDKGRKVSAVTKESAALIYLPEQPFKDFCSFERYCEEYEDLAQEEDGRWGRWSNPNAYWDWWTIGGRFSGLLMAKETSETALFIPREQVSQFVPPTLCNGVKMRDFDWEGLRKLQMETDERRYKILSEAFLTHDTSALHGPYSIKEDGIYNIFGEAVYKAGQTLQDFMGTRYDNFDPEGQWKNYPLSTFAFIDTDGEWHGKGEMGWFGVSFNDKEAEAWEEEMQAFLKSLNEDDYLVILDCHI